MAATRPAASRKKPTTSSRAKKREANSRKPAIWRSEEHTSELQSLRHLVCRLLLEKKKKQKNNKKQNQNENIQHNKNNKTTTRYNSIEAQNGHRGTIRRLQQRRSRQTYTTTTDSKK